MRIFPTNALHKAGIILVSAVLTSAACLLLALAAWFGANKGWFELGEYGPWLPLIGLEYGFLFGIVIGIVACKRGSRS
jgi:hypothetical protein